MTNITFTDYSSLKDVPPATFRKMVLKWNHKDSEHLFGVATQSKKAQIICVMKVNNKAVGWYARYQNMTYSWLSNRTKPCYSFFVDETHRSKGYGKMMIEHAIDRKKPAKMFEPASEIRDKIRAERRRNIIKP